MELRHLTNDELFRRYDGDLALRHRSQAGLKEDRRLLLHFKEALGQYPPSASLAKGFLGQFPHVRAATFHRYVSVLKKFLEWYGDPLDFKVRVPERVPEYIRPEEVQRLLEGIEAKRTHKGTAQRDILLVRTAVMTGLRRAELAALRVEDLDLVSGILRVRDGKGEKAANVPMPPSLVAALGPFLVDKEPGRSVFGLTPEGVSSLIDRAAKRVGVKLHAHSLRHHYVEALVDRGVDLRRVQLLARHSSLRTSQRYMGVRDAALSPTPSSSEPPSPWPSRTSALGRLLDEMCDKMRGIMGREASDQGLVLWALAFSHAYMTTGAKERLPQGVERQFVQDLRELGLT